MCTVRAIWADPDSRLDYAVGATVGLNQQRRRTSRVLYRFNAMCYDNGSLTNCAIETRRSNPPAAEPTKQSDVTGAESHEKRNR